MLAYERGASTRSINLVAPVGLQLQLAARHSWIDISRVGIWGHSGGGLASTDAILRFPDFYKLAVITSGNHHPDTYACYWAGRYRMTVSWRCHSLAAAACSAQPRSLPRAASPHTPVP